MNISCDIITDLLPLYHDGACNENSRKAVEEHLADCGQCRTMLEKIRNNSVDTFLTKERENVVRHHTRAVRKKLFITGISIASVMAVPVLVSLIVNLATGNALDWFFIVLTSLMVLASFTVVPLIFEKHRGLLTLGSFTGTLTLLLAACAIYTRGDWFLVAVIPVIFGLSVLFAPYALSRLPLKGFAARNKGLLAMALNTLLLFAVIIVSGLYTHYGSWIDYWRPAFLIASVYLLFPWGLFLILRYIKANALARAGLGTIFGGLFLSLGTGFADWFTAGAMSYNRFSGANLSVWNDSTINPNIFFLILITGCVIGGALLAAGLLRKKR